MMKNPYLDLNFCDLEAVLWKFIDIYGFHFRQNDPAYMLSSRAKNNAPEAPIEKQLTMIELVEDVILSKRDSDPKGAEYLLHLVSILKRFHECIELQRAGRPFKGMYAAHASQTGVLH